MYSLWLTDDRNWGLNEKCPWPVGLAYGLYCIWSFCLMLLCITTLLAVGNVLFLVSNRLYDSFSLRQTYICIYIHMYIYICMCMCTYLLHGAESFLGSQLVLQLVKKFPAHYGTRRFITVFTSARHLSLSWANSTQSPPRPTSRRSILILSSHLRLGLPNGLFPSGFPTITLYMYVYFGLINF